MFNLEVERRRKINLGGNSVTSSQASILERVHAQRLARAEIKKRTDSAIKIQAWYRGLREVRAVRRDLRNLFAEDVLSLTSLRCLVLIGKDDEVLSTWVRSVLAGGEGQIFVLAGGGDQQQHWIVLLRQASLLFLQSAATDPLSTNAELYLNFLNVLLSPESGASIVGSGEALSLVQVILEYLVQHEFYNLLGQCVQRIPIKSKDSPCLPRLFHLAVRPLSTVPTSSPQYSEYLVGIFVSLLTVPLLPSRLPLDVLSQFVASLPLKHFEILAPHITTIIGATSMEGRIEVAATMHMFISPHYKLLPPAAFQTYLQLSADLFNCFPHSMLDPSNKHRSTKLKSARHSAFNVGGYDSDDSDDPLVQAVTAFQPLPLPDSIPNVNDKTIKRLNTIVSAQHLRSIVHIAVSDRTLFPQLIRYLFAISMTWSSSRGEILDTILASTSGGLVRQIYRELVRNSQLGKTESLGVLADPANSPLFTPLIFLVDLYTQALLTMGDDEFFSTSNSSRRNPLTLDELIAFSKQLLNIAFPLYWRDDTVSTIGEAYISKDVRCTWGLLKEKLTRCLLAIHARDSRKPFVPPDHWLVTSQLDMNSFVEAAVIEEQSLSAGVDNLKQASARIHQRAAITPRLGILNNIPFSIPFAVRVTIFRHFVVNDMRERGSLNDHGSWNLRFDPFVRRSGARKSKVQVRRGMVSQDGFDRLAEVDLKAPLEIGFIDQFGQEEAGIDGGGLFKEFFTSLCKEVFDTDRGLWLANKKNELYPNPHTYATESHSLNWYRFIGRILGKAMYEGILVDVAFAGFFLSKWLGRQSFLDDLASLDPELYNGLIFLKHYDGNLEDLALNFTVATDEFGVMKTTDLIPNGSNTAVTKENRLLYIHLVSHHRLSKQIKKQSEAFFDGLSEMIDQRWLRMFNQQEVQILIGGANTPIDIADLQQHTNYGGAFNADHPTIVSFWEVVQSFDQEQKKALLRFVTSCSRPPLLGFRELIPNFSIRDSGIDEHRLPSSSTCVNLLKLPCYSNERVLRAKVLQAINAGAGFDLS